MFDKSIMRTGIITINVLMNLKSISWIYFVLYVKWNVNFNFLFKYYKFLIFNLYIFKNKLWSIKKIFKKKKKKNKKIIWFN